MCPCIKLGGFRVVTAINAKSPSVFSLEFVMEDELEAEGTTWSCGRVVGEILKVTIKQGSVDRRQVSRRPFD